MILAWGAKVSPEFRARVVRLAEAIRTNPSWLMAAMAFETGGSFSPSVRSPVSSATGLIQFMDSTARALGTTTEHLASLTAVEQLDYVERYLSPYAGRLTTLGDVYCAILWPAAVGKPDDYAMMLDGSAAYRANAGLDKDHSGAITKGEVTATVQRMLDTGMLPGNAADSETQPAAPIVEAGRDYTPPPDAPEPPTTRAALADVPSTVANRTGASMPILAALLPTIVGAIPSLISIFGKGAQADKNARAAQIVADTVVQATNSLNLQEATEKITSDPAALAAATQAVNDNTVLLQMMEVGAGGIAAARKAASDPVQLPFYRNSAFILTVLLLPMPYYVVIAVMTGSVDVSGEVRAGVISAVITGVLSAILGYWLGTSFGSSRKTELLAEQR